MKCAAYKCKSHINSRNDNGQPLIFHRFPKDESLISIWLKNMCMENWQPSEHSRLCSKHFTSDCYIRNSTICLRKHAIPTIFEEYPDDEEQEEQEIKVEEDDIIIEEEEDDNTIKEEEEDVTIEDEEYVASQSPTTVFPPDIVYLPQNTYADDHKKEIALLKAELSTTKRRLNKATELAKRRLKKLRALQQQLRRRQNSNGKGSATVISIFKDYFVEFKSK